MASIQITDVTLDYPVYDLNDFSLKRRFLSSAGAKAPPITHIRALEDLNLTIRSGERVGLYGPNGSGKTTLLRVMAGIYPVSKGRLSITGHVLPLLGLGVGVNHDVTAEDNIRLLLRVEGITPTQALVDDIWAFTEIDDTMRRLPLRTFSSGMLMRVLFSVSTAFSTDILLLDEWLSVVDEQFSAKAEQRMQEVVEQTRILVMASHNLERLARTCTRIIGLTKGRVIADVPASQIRTELTQSKEPPFAPLMEDIERALEAPYSRP